MFSKYKRKLRSRSYAAYSEEKLVLCLGVVRNKVGNDTKTSRQNICGLSRSKMDTRYNRTKHGCMDDATFEECFNVHHLPYLDNNPVKKLLSEIT